MKNQAGDRWLWLSIISTFLLLSIYNLFIFLTNPRFGMKIYVYAWNHVQIQQRNLVMTLTKAHIVESVAEQNGYPKKQSFDTVETLLELIKRFLESGRDFLVIGFGKFWEISGTS